VGVTADQFARLGGPEALQLYVTSLEKAGVTQAEMTFYLEAMASDLTMLLPLLRNGGAEMRALGDEAQRAGRILSEDAIDGAVELNREMNTLTATISDKLTKAILDNKDELLALVNFITETAIPAIGTLITNISRAVELYNVARGIGDGGGVAEPTEDEKERDAQTIKRQPGEGDTSSTGLVYFDPETGEIKEYGDDTPEIPGVTVPAPPPPPAKPEKPGTPATTETGGGGGGSGLSRDDFDVLRQRFATEYEIMAEEYERQQALLEEYHAAGIASETEYKEAMLRLEEDYGARKRRAVMDDTSGLSELMRAENENLFKIGKTAALARAIVNGEEAATAAWNRGMAAGGPVAAAAYATASAARTGISIQNIRNASIGGGGGGASSGGGAAAAPAAADTLNVNLSVAGQAGAMTDPAAVDGFASMLLDNFRDRGVVVNVR
jgi:hypothetical protein